MDKVSNKERDWEEWEDKNRILCGEMRRQSCLREGLRRKEQDRRDG